MKDPAFLMYSKDWLTGTAEFSPGEKGIYIDLLCFQHQNKGIPSSTEKIARCVGLSVEQFEPIWSEIKHKFEPGENGRLFNARLQRESNARQESGKLKSILGIYGNFMKKCDEPKTILAEIKKAFDAQEFMDIPKENLQESVLSKLQAILIAKRDAKRSHIIGDVNEDANAILSKGGAGGKFKVLDLIPKNWIADEFESLWKEFEEVRSKKRKPLTDNAKERRVQELIKLSGGDWEIAKASMVRTIDKAYDQFYGIEQKENAPKSLGQMTPEEQKEYYSEKL